MARLPYIEMNDAPQEVREIYEKTLRGKPGSVQKLIAHRPEVLKNFLPFYASVGRSLERRLYDRLPERLEEERDAPRRSLLYGFPQQFAMLRDRLVQFVDAAFAPSKLEAKLVIRGVYFTSGTQEGSPIDRVMGALARGFGLERRLLPAQRLLPGKHLGRADRQRTQPTDPDEIPSIHGMKE